MEKILGTLKEMSHATTTLKEYADMDLDATSTIPSLKITNQIPAFTIDNFPTINHRLDLVAKKIFLRKINL